MKPFAEISTTGLEGGSTILDRVIEAVAISFRSLVLAVTNDRLVRVRFTVPATDMLVTHGLGSPPRSWEVVDIDGDANVWRSATKSPAPKMVIVLQASAACSVLLRFT